MSIIHGIDSNSKVVPLLLDSTGKVILSGTVSVSGTITVQQTVPSSLTTGNHIYDGTNWQKLAGQSSGILKAGFIPQTIFLESGVTQILKNGSAVNQTTTLYTVTTGKKFYMTSLLVSTYNIAASPQSVTLDIYNTVPTSQISWVTIAPAGSANSINLSLVPPLELLAGWTVKLFSANANTAGYSAITGYEL